jgi:cytochrome c5
VADHFLGTSPAPRRDPVLTLARYKTAALLVAAIALSACHDDGHHDDDHAHDHDHDDVPDDYAGLSNPLADDPGAAGRGLATYQRDCAECHGEQARGHGPRATELSPPPSDLVEVASRDDVTDGYLFWRISDGGEAAMTAMPAWRDALSDDEIWELISFLYAHARDAR